MKAAIALALKARVVAFVFVYGFAVQICQPRLDVPGRHENGSMIGFVSWRHRRLAAFIIERRQPGINADGVAVQHDHKLAAYSVSVSAIYLKLLRKFLSDELFCRTFGQR